MKNQLCDPHALNITPNGIYSGSWGSKFSKINVVVLNANKGITNESLERVNRIINSGAFTVTVDGIGKTTITRKYPWENGEWENIE
jgi:hypothetical protein